MTREEAIAYGKRVIDLGLNDETQAFCEYAIKALEQQSCDGAISRADAVRVASGYCHPSNIAKELAKLPPVHPKLTECEDAISREDAIMCMTGEYIADMTYKPEDIISKHIRRLRALPPVTPKPETAHWIKVPDEETFFCSKCNARLYDEQTYLPLNFCPNCGRKMVEPQESEE